LQKQANFVQIIKQYLNIKRIEIKGKKMGRPAREQKDQYTYKDYLSWEDQERWEIINGTAHNMPPSPGFEHQRISMAIIEVLLNSKDKLRECTLLHAPLDVVLSETNIVQPDIFIICDQQKIKAQHIKGAPELIFEIISPGTATRDKREKKDIYEQFGVKEYILVYPNLKNVEQYILSKTQYGKAEIINWDETFTLETFALEIDLRKIFNQQ
jgi:Uma2 family endonuclease